MPPTRLWRSFFTLESRAWRRRARDPLEQDRIGAAVDWLAEYVRSEGSVLDLGCGAGNFALALARRGYHVVGIDFSPGMLREARAASEEPGLTDVEWLEGDLNGPLALRSAAYDGALSHFALQYLESPPAFFAEVRRVLRPGGAFLLGAPARDWRPGVAPQRRYWQVRLWVSRVPGVLRRFTADELRTELCDAGFSIAGYRRYPGGHLVMAQAQS